MDDLITRQEIEEAVEEISSEKKRQILQSPHRGKYRKHFSSFSKTYVDQLKRY